jgi:hypothetical protein
MGHGYRGLRTVIAALTLAVVLPPGAAPDVDAAVVVCKRKQKLRLRETACKATEQPVQMAGDAVDPTTLPEVPAAAHADTATTATSATSAASAGTAGDAALLGGLPPSAFQGRIRWALVAAGGTEIVTQSGGFTLVAEPVLGIVVLNLGEDLRGRAVLATVRGGLTNKGWAQVAICGGGNGGGAETSLCNVGGSVTDMPNELAVATVDPDGNAVDRSFYVAVLP